MPKPPLAPFWSTADGKTVKMFRGNVTDVLARLPEKSVHCVVTSPPYWGLRDYKAGAEELGSEKSPDCSIGGQAFCGECHVCRMREVFREVRRVLRDDGVCWLNYGSSYWSGSNPVDDDPTLTLRDDLTPDELRYVLAEMAAGIGQDGEVVEPN